jgi:hypothetical protein
MDENLLRALGMVQALQRQRFATPPGVAMPPGAQLYPWAGVPPEVLMQQIAPMAPESVPSDARTEMVSGPGPQR